ncbi:hypothetical protein S40288_10869 [Stachybotrys chartarum IBT 40288]|nr:hypothetical protein S40288_10869 [Stachybotrys chartarum IBT 40288]
MLAEPKVCGRLDAPGSDRRIYSQSGAETSPSLACSAGCDTRRRVPSYPGTLGQQGKCKGVVTLAALRSRHGLSPGSWLDLPWCACRLDFPEGSPLLPANGWLGPSASGPPTYASHGSASPSQPTHASLPSNHQAPCLQHKPLSSQNFQSSSTLPDFLSPSPSTRFHLPPPLQPPALTTLPPLDDYACVIALPAIRPLRNRFFSPRPSLSRWLLCLASASSRRRSVVPFLTFRPLAWLRFSFHRLFRAIPFPSDALSHIDLVLRGFSSTGSTTSPRFANSIGTGNTQNLHRPRCIPRPDDNYTPSSRRIAGTGEDSLEA